MVPPRGSYQLRGDFSCVVAMIKKKRKNSIKKCLPHDMFSSGHDSRLADLTRGGVGKSSFFRLSLRQPSPAVEGNQPNSCGSGLLSSARPFLWRPFAIPFAAMGLRGPVLKETWGHVTCSTGSRHGLCRRRNVAIFGGGPEGSFSPLLRSTGTILNFIPPRVTQTENVTFFI